MQGYKAITKGGTGEGIVLPWERGAIVRFKEPKHEVPFIHSEDHNVVQKENLARNTLASGRLERTWLCTIMARNTSN